jgi:hypothetical protein
MRAGGWLAGEDRSGAEAPRIAGNVQRVFGLTLVTRFTREERPMRRNLTSVSAIWLFLLSALAKRNGLLALGSHGDGRPVSRGACGLSCV